jgi:hypothetical protein
MWAVPTVAWLSRSLALLPHENTGPMYSITAVRPDALALVTPDVVLPVRQAWRSLSAAGCIGRPS